MKECRQCDYENPIRKGRAYWVCKDCWRDITIELFFIIEEFNK